MDSKYIRKVIFILILCTCSLAAQNNRYVTFSTVNTRPAGMGGAFYSIEDNLPAMVYNPACFNLWSDQVKKRLTLFFNPLPPVFIFERPEDFALENGSGFSKLMKSLSLMAKGIGFSFSSFNGGILFSEELIPFSSEHINNGNKEFFDAEDFIKNHYHALVFNVNLAQSLSIGVTNNLFYREDGDDDIYKFSMSYGLLLKPSDKYKIGLTYMDLPAQFNESRRRFGRIADETINAGFSYYFNENTILSIDLRNLNEDEVKTFCLRELHFGFEKTFLNHLSLRSGYFRVAQRDNESRSDVFSLGLSFFDLNTFWDESAVSVNKKPFLSYSFLLEKGKETDMRWHFLTISLCI